jgi:predicted enzyme related to lactoylglutathione lyase
MRATDLAALSAWYRDCLGLDADENGLWRQGAGLTVFATFESETDYFGALAQQTMLNFRVRDLDATLVQLRAKGAEVAKETQDMKGVGRFGWVTDPVGNRVELWQPAWPRLHAVTCWWPTSCRSVNLWSGPPGHVHYAFYEPSREHLDELVAELAPRWEARCESGLRQQRRSDRTALGQNACWCSPTYCL